MLLISTLAFVDFVCIMFWHFVLSESGSRYQCKSCSGEAKVSYKSLHLCICCSIQRLVTLSSYDCVGRFSFGLNLVRRAAITNSFPSRCSLQGSDPLGPDPTFRGPGLPFKAKLHNSSLTVQRPSTGALNTPDNT